MSRKDFDKMLAIRNKINCQINVAQVIKELRKRQQENCT